MNYDIRKQLEELQKYYYIAIDEAFNAKTVLGETIFEEMRQDLFDRYKIERDQLKKKAKILDKNIEFEINLKIYELTPHRRGFLWILKNEARKLKEREVNVDDRIELDTRTANVEMLEEKIYAEAEPLFEKPSLFRRIFKRNKATAETTTAPQADNVQSETPTTTAAPAPALPAPTSEAAEPAPVACGAAHHAYDVDGKPNATAPTVEEPKPKAKRKVKPKKIAATATEPPAPTAPAPQLSGQIAMDELNNK